MLAPTQALAIIPAGLRDPLFEEYGRIVQSYMERKWLPAELGGGRFCEIVYTILDGFATGNYAAAPTKPANFVQACRQLEVRPNVPRSFQILLPRLLPALYEIRNNRGVGHVGGDVDSNYMDATAVLTTANWIMAELIRVFHQLPTDEAQKTVDALVERRVPIIWQTGDIKRVLDTSLNLRDRVLLLMNSSPGQVVLSDLLKWTGHENHAYFTRLVRTLHKERLIELSEDESSAIILPPGTKYIEETLLPKLV